LLGDISLGLKLLITIVVKRTTAPIVPMTRFDDTSSPVPNSFTNQSFIATKLCQKEKPLAGLCLNQLMISPTLRDPSAR